jgi:hypothetical protein
MAKQIFIRKVSGEDGDDEIELKEGKLFQTWPEF